MLAPFRWHLVSRSRIAGGGSSGTVLLSRFLNRTFNSPYNEAWWDAVIESVARKDISFHAATELDNAFVEDVLLHNSVNDHYGALLNIKRSAAGAVKMQNSACCDSHGAKCRSLKNQRFVDNSCSVSQAFIWSQDLLPHRAMRVGITIFPDAGTALPSDGGVANDPGVP